jgi:hypothetical protein
MRSLRRHPWQKTAWSVALVTVVVLCAFSSHVEAHTKRVQELLDLAYSATRHQDWVLAIRYYGDAQKEVPNDPTLLFNLGTAYAKAEKPIASLIWFRASQATGKSPVPDEVIEEKIRDQRIIAQSAMQAFIAEAIKAGFPATCYEKYGSGPGLVFGLREAGDLEGALEVLELLTSHPPTSQACFEEAQARDAKASKTQTFVTIHPGAAPVIERHSRLAKQRPAPTKEETADKDATKAADEYLEVARAALKEGDNFRANKALSRADFLADGIQEKKARVAEKLAIADLALETGDKHRAISLVAAQNYAGTGVRLQLHAAELALGANDRDHAIALLHDSLSNTGDDLIPYDDVAKTALDANDTDFAQDAIRKAVAAATESRSDYRILDAIGLQLRAGMFGEAHQTMTSLKDNSRCEALALIAKEELKHRPGDQANRAITEYEQERNCHSPEVEVEFAKLAARNGDINSAKTYLKLGLAILDTRKDHFYFTVPWILTIAESYQTIGDATAARAALGRIPEPETLFKSLSSEREDISLLETITETQSQLGDLSGARRTIDFMKARRDPDLTDPRRLPASIGRAMGALAKAAARKGDISLARGLLDEMPDCQVQEATAMDVAKIEMGQGRRGNARSVLAGAETSAWLDMLEAPVRTCDVLMGMARTHEVATAFSPTQYFKEQISKEEPTKFPQALIQGADKIAEYLRWIHKEELKWRRIKADLSGN